MPGVASTANQEVLTMLLPAKALPVNKDAIAQRQCSSSAKLVHITALLLQHTFCPQTAQSAAQHPEGRHCHRCCDRCSAQRSGCTAAPLSSASPGGSPEQRAPAAPAPRWAAWALCARTLAGPLVLVRALLLPGACSRYAWAALHTKYFGASNSASASLGASASRLAWTLVGSWGRKATLHGASPLVHLEL